MLSAGAFAQMQQTLKCGICLDLYTRPCTIPCGHSYCQVLLPPLSILRDSLTRMYSYQECLRGWMMTSKNVKCPECNTQLPMARRFEFNLNPNLDQIVTHIRSQMETPEVPTHIQTLKPSCKMHPLTPPFSIHDPSG